MFSNIFKFIDDLWSINNDEFEKSYLKLKKENEDPCKASFLDLSIDVHDEKFPTMLFAKRVAFPIYNNRIPYLDSYIPSKLFIDSVKSEMIRIVRTTSDLINMITHANLLLIWMKKQGSECDCIISLLEKIFGNTYLYTKYFTSLWILLMNLLHSSRYN